MTPARTKDKRKRSKTRKKRRTMRDRSHARTLGKGLRIDGSGTSGTSTISAISGCSRSSVSPGTPKPATPGRFKTSQPRIVSSCTQAAFSSRALTRRRGAQPSRDSRLSPVASSPLSYGTEMRLQAESASLIPRRRVPLPSRWALWLVLTPAPLPPTRWALWLVLTACACPRR